MRAQGLAAPSEAQTRGWIGDGIEVLIERALAHAAGTTAGRDVYDAVLVAFDHCYREHLFDRSHVYPGVPETLAALRAQGIRLACITNKRLSFARDLLERAGLSEYLDLVYGGDSFADKKPSPVQLLAAASELGVAPAAAVHVGDSAHDLDAARAAGFDFVWAEYGYTSAMLERDALPACRISRFPELLDLVLGA